MVERLITFALHCDYPQSEMCPVGQRATSPLPFPPGNEPPLLHLLQVQHPVHVRLVVVPAEPTRLDDGIDAWGGPWLVVGQQTLLPGYHLCWGAVGAAHNLAVAAVPSLDLSAALDGFEGLAVPLWGNMDLGVGV